MRLISHRGNLNGPNPEQENHPDYIWEAIRAGYDVEIDVWYVEDKFKLGHDNPQYDFPFDLVSNHASKMWIHCKNIEALQQFIKIDNNGSYFNYFWHEEDTVTLTSKNYIWAYPSNKPISNSIAVMPEWYSEESNVSECYGVCSDYIKNYG